MPDLKVKGGSALIVNAAGVDGQLAYGGSFASGQAYESTVVDFGAVFDDEYMVTCEVGVATAPTNGASYKLFFGARADAGQTLPGDLAGLAQQYKSGSESQWTTLLNPLGTLPTIPVGSDVLKKCINPYWRPPARYCAFVIHNLSAQTAGAENLFQLRFEPRIRHTV